MKPEEIKRKRLIRFIKLNKPLYAFARFDWHSMEQLEKIKKDIIHGNPPAHPHEREARGGARRQGEEQGCA